MTPWTSRMIGTIVNKGYPWEYRVRISSEHLALRLGSRKTFTSRMV